MTSMKTKKTLKIMSNEEEIKDALLFDKIPYEFTSELEDWEEAIGEYEEVQVLKLFGSNTRPLRLFKEELECKRQMFLD